MPWSVWDGVPVQRCTVHKHRNLLAHAPERLHDEITADYNDMIYATTPEEIEVRRKAFIRKWRLKHRAVNRLLSTRDMGEDVDPGSAQENHARPCSC
jgi:transposase-like protein